MEIYKTGDICPEDSYYILVETGELIGAEKNDKFGSHNQGRAHFLKASAEELESALRKLKERNQLPK